MKLADWLREKRQYITREVSYLEGGFDPTYGKLEPSERSMTVIDFDALCEAIDQFEQEFKGE